MATHEEILGQLDPYNNWDWDSLVGIADSNPVEKVAIHQMFTTLISNLQQPISTEMKTKALYAALIARGLILPIPPKSSYEVAAEEYEEIIAMQKVWEG